MSDAWVDSGVTVGTSLNNRHESVAVIQEGESESREMIAIIERNREDRERKVVIDRYHHFPPIKGQFPVALSLHRRP
jgi:hypothetical protein